MMQPERDDCAGVAFGFVISIVKAQRFIDDLTQTDIASARKFCPPLVLSVQRASELVLTCTLGKCGFEL